MAIRDSEGNIVLPQKLRKQKTPSKKEIEKSLKGKEVWYIAKPSFYLYDWVVLEDNWDTAKVRLICRHYLYRWEETIENIKVKELQLTK